MKVEVEKPPRDALWRWIWVVAFAIAFAWVETSAVVYLREIYFEGSFSFPLVVHWEEGKHVVDQFVRIEFGREIATMLMLAAVGCVAGRNALQRFCFFMIAFGVWDVFYYIWLRVLVGWPQSLMTWDLLFFVPLPWVGQVITPVLISVTMVGAASLIVSLEERGRLIRLSWHDWVIEAACGVLVVVAFCWDWKNILQVPDGLERSGIPNPFAWWLFLPAYLFSVAYFGVRIGQMARSAIRPLQAEKSGACASE